MGIGDRLYHAWNAFLNKDPTSFGSPSGPGYSMRIDRPRFSRGNERSIINSIYNRIAIDASQVAIKHVRLDKNGRYKETVDSGLNNCLNLEANIDQTGQAFKLDLFISMLDEGCIALVPIDTTIDPENSNAYDIDSIRVGQIVEWFPSDVKVRIYNEMTGRKQDVILPKKMVSIVENPFYAVMNEPNSIMQRLIRKLNLLDVIDEQSGSGKLDLIIQLPYAVKTDYKRQQANERRQEIEDQINNNKLGIAYIDAAEHVTQLNRSVDNNLMKQIEYLTSMLYSQLGITQEIMNGTADQKTMTNYLSRTIEPIVSAPVDEMKRKFLSKTARTQGQSIMMFQDPFKLLPVADLAEMADKLTRNEIMTSNEFRQVIGMAPSTDPSADELRNKNLSAPTDNNADEQLKLENEKLKEEIQNGTK